jgi:acetyltransferase EpsM
VINDYPVLGRPEAMTSNEYADVYFSYNPLLSMQYIKNNAHRLERMGLPDERFATIIHPTTFISRYAQIGFGVVIMPLAHVRQNARIGNHCTLLYGASLGHDSVMEDFSYLGNNAVTGSEVVMEKGSFLGTNSSTRERLRIGKWSVVGLGSVVIQDVKTMTVVAGNPARFVKERSFEVFTPKD